MEQRKGHSGGMGWSMHKGGACTRPFAVWVRLGIRRRMWGTVSVYMGVMRLEGCGAECRVGELMEVGGIGKTVGDGIKL